MAGDEQPKVQRVYPERSHMVGAVRLYRDDLERIEELFTGFGQAEWGMGVKFQTDERAGDDLAAVLDAEPGGHIRRFTAIRYDKPLMHLAVTADRTHVSLGESRPEFRGPYEELVELVNSRHRRVLSAWLGLWPVILTLAALAVTWPIIAVGVDRNWGPIVSIGIALAAAVGVMLAGQQLKTLLWAREGGASIIYLTPRHETPGFWSRHGENLGVEAVKAILYGLVGALITWVVTHLG